MTTEEMKQRCQKSKERRYQKPILNQLNYEAILSDLEEMSAVAGDVRYFCETEDESLLESLVGDEEEAFEIKTMISQLYDDVDQMFNDLGEEWVPECFDLLFVRVAGARSRVANRFGGFAGFDDYQGDYYGLESAWEMDGAIEEAEKKLLKLTKKELVQAATQCFLVAANYMALKNRYDSLKDSIDILQGRNAGIIAAVKEIETAYVAAEKNGFLLFDKATREFDQMTEQLPDEVWVQ